MVKLIEKINWEGSVKCENAALTFQPKIGIFNDGILFHVHGQIAVSIMHVTKLGRSVYWDQFENIVCLL